MFNDLHHRKLLFWYFLLQVQVLDNSTQIYVSTNLNYVQNPNDFSYSYFLDVRRSGVAVLTSEIQ